MDRLRFANTSTPTTSAPWQRLSDDERLTLVADTIGAKAPSLVDILVIAAAKPDGQVIVGLLEPVPADKRGTLLLDLEILLKDSIDPGLVVWMAPLGDRNSLRNLRGIEVKA